MAVETNHSRYTENTDPNSVPDFTKGYDLPEGWQWDCYEDGSGGLDAPNGQSYFSYDLATGRMRNERGDYTYIHDSDWIKDRLERYVLPEHKDRIAFEAEHPDWFRAYGLYGNRRVFISDDITRVAISPNMNMDANEFRELLAKAHNAEAHFSDGMISVSDFARKLEAAYPDSLIYKGETFKAASMQGPEAEKRQNRVDGYSLSSERRDMQTAKEALSAEHSVGSLDRQGQDVR